MPIARRKSKLYTMRVGEVRWSGNYDYGVSHISKRTKRRFIQRQHGKRFFAVRVR